MKAFVSTVQSMDTDNSGTITADELRVAMTKQGSPLVQEELQRLLESIDVDATGRCTFWLVALCSSFS